MRARGTVESAEGLVDTRSVPFQFWPKSLCQWLQYREGATRRRTVSSRLRIVGDVSPSSRIPYLNFLSLFPYPLLYFLHEEPFPLYPHLLFSIEIREIENFNPKNLKKEFQRQARTEVAVLSATLVSSILFFFVFFYYFHFLRYEQHSAI